MQNPITPQRQTSDPTSSPLSSPPADIITPPWMRSEDPPWTTEDFKAIHQFFRTQYGPFALGSIVRMLGRRDFSDVAAHLITFRQSALAVEVTRSQRNHPGHDAPIAHKIDGTFSIFGGVHEMNILPDHPPLREKPKWYMPFDPSSKTKESDETKAHRSTKNIPASTKSARTHAIKPNPRQSDRECSVVVENVLQVAPEAVDRAYASAFQAIDEMVSANLETTYGQRPAFGDALILAHRRNVIQETLPLFGNKRWMNDTAVTLVLSKLVLRDERCSTIDPIVSKAVAESEVGEVQRLQQKFRQAHGDKETILVPVNIENQHWCPQQPNTYDCGLFVMRQADLLTAATIPNYTEPPLETSALRAYYKAIFLAGNPE
ncbi:hypothetical protein K4K49_003985 [Colletotrichum sp. SAR 10_70]|nr:hypothetical protein K4K50_003139 [Colletotrichum sp. SAR 10_71]KAI8171743.1 hypothetical protein K4K49_003985 [Colletotrichum sp. SAR 10_70]KAI8194018.1 hypothetical protein KHU50_012056 [Colletotrichum sp. SAR 10_65]KAI8251829.1 hypothetical protein K4K53_011816 [Colletotrichum sp. SAR 10_77]